MIGVPTSATDPTSPIAVAVGPQTIDAQAPEISQRKVSDVLNRREIAELKMVDLNANDLDQAAKIIAGSARSMGLAVEG